MMPNKSLDSRDLDSFSYSKTVKNGFILIAKNERLSALRRNYCALTKALMSLIKDIAKN